MYRNFDDWAIDNNINVSTNPHRDWEKRKYVWSETEKFWRCWEAAEQSVHLTPGNLRHCKWYNSDKEK